MADDIAATWRGRSDEQVLDATKRLDDYTPASQQVILGEAARRGLLSPSPAAPPLEPHAWWYAQGGQKVGPVPSDTLLSLLRRGELPMQTVVWREGLAQWTEAGTVPELVTQLAPPRVGGSPTAGACPACGLANPPNRTHCSRCATPLMAGAWRDDKLLVLRKGSALPQRCIRCNQPAAGGVKRTYYWHPPLLYVLAVFALLIYAIVAVVVRKKAEVTVPFCAQHHKRYRLAHIGSSLLAVGGVVLLLVAIGGGAVYGWTGLLMFVAGATWGSIESRTLTPASIDDHFARFKGVRPDYLSQLPPWLA